MNCDNDQRRALVRAHRDANNRPDMNGLDYVELGDDGQSLQAYFIGKLPVALRTNQAALLRLLRIEGGRRVRDIKILHAETHIEKDPSLDDYLILHLDRQGDFSTYTLRLVGVKGIDPFYDHADFSFKVDCTSDMDCAAPNPCPPPQLDEPEIDYLSRDYSSFRQLVLDRLALIMPDWKERHAPDLGIALVEVLAYVGDHLSYYQDAVATEAYLDTARQRISVRRHARLVDYYLHEGNNARAWLALSISGTPSLDMNLDEVFFLAMLDSSDAITPDLLSPDAFLQLAVDTYEVFEPVLRTKFTVYQAHNEIQFYTWGQDDCCLPRGTHSASLLDAWVGIPEAPAATAPAAQSGPTTPDTSKLGRALKLKAGDVLIFEEVIGPKTGNPADADPARRVAVRLTKVTRNEDAVVLTPFLSGEISTLLPTPVLDIEWQVEDALPFALCLSAVSDAPGCLALTNISVVRGNVILVDHGRSLQPPEEIGTVPLASFEAQCDCDGSLGEVAYLPGRYRPTLKHSPLTYRAGLPADKPAQHKWISAKSMLLQDAHAALPQISLSEVPGATDGQGGLTPLLKLEDLNDMAGLVGRMLDPNDSGGALLRGRISAHAQRALNQLTAGQAPPPALLAEILGNLQALLRTWEPRFDLLASGPDDLHFVVEIDNDSQAHLRFGDHDLGEQAPAGSTFYASYRVGNGSSGNLGAESIHHTVFNLSGGTLQVRNPLPAVGGSDPQPIAEARLYAPYQFRTQLERAIVADDYGQIALREFKPELQGAAADLAWSGSWYEVEVAVDPLHAESATPALEHTIRRGLERYRRMGHDLRVEQARYVPLEIELSVCVKADYLRGHVRAALLEVFSNRLMSNGAPGFFHPDRLIFGEDIALSRIVAQAMAVDGVTAVEVTKLQRLFEATNHEIQNGVLPLGPFEIAQVDNDPNYPEHGRFSLVMMGGR